MIDNLTGRYLLNISEYYQKKIIKKKIYMKEWEYKHKKGGKIQIFKRETSREN